MTLEINNKETGYVFAFAPKSSRGFKSMKMKKKKNKKKRSVGVTEVTNCYCYHSDGGTQNLQFDDWPGEKDPKKTIRANFLKGNKGCCQRLINASRSLHCTGL